MSGGKEQLSVIQEKLEIILRMWHELQRGEAGERGEMEEVWSGGILYFKKKILLQMYLFRQCFANRKCILSSQ